MMRPSSRTTSKSKWTDGPSFDFKQSSSSSASSLQKAKNRRQSTILKRLEIDMTADGGASVSPTSPVLRRTRRMSVARTKSSSSAAVMRPPAVKQSAAARNMTSKTSLSKLKDSSSPVITTKQSKTPGNVIRTASSKASKIPTPTNASQESCLDKINSPQIFYKQMLSSPTVKLSGAQRRKSYVSATSGILEVATGQKRPLDEEQTPLPDTKRSKLANSRSQSKSKIPTPSNSVKSTSSAKLQTTSSSKSIKRSFSTAARAALKSTSKVNEVKSTKSKESPVRGARITRSRSAVSSSKSTNKSKSPVLSKPANTRRRSVSRATINKPKQSVNTTNSKQRSSPTPMKSERPSTPEQSPIIPRNTRLTRSAKRLGRKNAPSAREIANETDMKNEEPSSPNVINSGPVVAVANIASPADLSKALRPEPQGKKTVVSPNTIKFLTSTTKVNPFTPKPEAQPSKLLKQHFKHKLNVRLHSDGSSSEVSVRTDAERVPVEEEEEDAAAPQPMVDPRLATVSTPTRAMLTEAGFIPGDTPASAVRFPSTPKSATSLRFPDNRSKRMVASARRKISLTKDFPKPQCYVNSTPMCPRKNGAAIGNGAANGNGAVHREEEDELLQMSSAGVNLSVSSDTAEVTTTNNDDDNDDFSLYLEAEDDEEENNDNPEPLIDFPPQQQVQSDVPSRKSMCSLM